METLPETPQAAHPKRTEVLLLAALEKLSPDETGAVLHAAFPWPTRAEWLRYGRLLSVVSGTLLLLTGIIFFFAYNWAELHRFAKLGIVGGLFVSVGLTAALFFRRPLVSHSLQTAVFVLCGTLLALFGQIYQTGANAYDLFLGWALLCIPVALVSTTYVVWFLWLLVANLCFQLYGIQVIGGWLQPHLTMAASGLCVLGLGVFEAHSKLTGATGRRTFALLVALLALAMPVLQSSIHIHTKETVGGGLLVLFTLAVIGAGSYVYFALIRDLAILAVCALSGMTFFFSMFLLSAENEPAVIFLVGGLLLIGMTAGLVLLLLRVRRHWEENP